MKYINNLFVLLVFSFSANLMAAPDYTEITGSVGMSKEQVKEKFGAPDKAMDALVDPNSKGTWIYRNVIHPDSGKPVSCHMVFYATGVAAVRCL